MKTIGLIGGMSWESSLLYYQLINSAVKQRLGGLHSAQLLMYSVDFAPIEKLQHAGDWDGAADVLIDAARRLEAGGADFFLIGTNTMHRVADDVCAAVSIPLLHIADATAEILQADDVKRIGLLGTAFTMELDFYRDRIGEHYGIEVLVPELHDRQMVHDIIYQELCRGQVEAESREVYLAIIDRLREQHIDGVILACTEIGLLLQPQHTDIKLYDSTAIHAHRAVELALQ
ncbi:MAG: aspartate/glutamate racemase family protein [Gammaproteobacteria bacterium]|nr:aspartate/glutamate racemase family protein [Gammaproteobacteria bacterium]